VVYDWFVCLALGRRLDHFPPQFYGNKGIKLLRRAVQLAPNVSYTHYILAESLRSGYTPDEAAADKEFKKAGELQPPCALAAMERLNIASHTHNKPNAHEAKLTLLDQMPSAYPDAVKWKGFLSKVK